MTASTGQVVAPSGAYFVARRCAYWQLVVDGDGDCGNGDGNGDGDDDCDGGADGDADANGDGDVDVDAGDNARNR